MKQDKETLRKWQERLTKNEAAYQAELDRMPGRDALFAGTHTLEPVVRGDRKRTAGHVRNLCAELIEAQVDSNIPAPKVTARRKKDEHLAKVIEDMLRNEIDRLPMESVNDLMERIVPVQGGAAFLVEWDDTQRTHTTLGEVAVSVLHPRQIIPQDGITDDIEGADYVILKLPQSKESIRQRYGVDLEDEREAEPEIRGGSGAGEDLVTQYTAYYRNRDGGIGKFSWVNDVVLEDIEDYQARRIKRCWNCGMVQGAAVGLTPLEPATPDGKPPAPEPARNQGKAVCPFCGSTKWETSVEEFEEIWTPIPRWDGSVIPGAQPVELPGGDGITEEGMGAYAMEPTRVPYYEPNIYPVVLLKNVSVHGKFLGESDIDRIADQQRTVNRIESKIIDKLLKSGSYLSLPTDAKIRHDAEEMKVIYPGSIQDMEMIRVFDMEGNIQQDLAYLNQVYEEARQVVGITDSFQGRRDTTATSGKAREIAVAQSAGRLESKKVMKNAAYAALYEAIFKFKLAYADEPRPVVSTDIHGSPEYEEFNRYDFLEQDAAGEWHWNDQFLFSCDTSAPLAGNREAMWQETRLNLQTGAFGDPSSIDTLILFWTKMEGLHYPLAADTLDYLKEQKQRQMQEQMQMQQMQMQQMQQQEQARIEAARQRA